MKKIFLAGHKGMVGSAILRRLQKQSDVEVIVRARRELDLCNQTAVHEFVKNERPDEIILAAAKVGGIYANNKYPAEFIYQNLQIQNNVIHAAVQSFSIFSKINFVRPYGDTGAVGIVSI